MEESPRLKYLFEKYLANELDSVERTELLHYIRSHHQEEAVKELIGDQIDRQDAGESIPDHFLSEKQASEVLDSILRRPSTPVVTMKKAGPAKRSRYLWAAAAAVLAILGAAVMFRYIAGTEKGKRPQLLSEQRY